ncbi:MAG TPA: hypothetical protein VGP26_31540 [Actinophytocola sp.]|jgi:hypothetical protein|nr:hypothetical protein [Actinophytocola sp.]
MNAGEPRGYVDQYPSHASRFGALPAEVRKSLVRGVVEAQMCDSFLNDHFNKDLRDRFRARFKSAIDDITNATTARQRNVAIERYNQTAGDYNAAELVERDNFAGHPTDADGRIVREEPKAMSDPGLAPNQLPNNTVSRWGTAVCVNCRNSWCFVYHAA